MHKVYGLSQNIPLSVVCNDPKLWAKTCTLSINCLMCTWEKSINRQDSRPWAVDSICRPLHCHRPPGWDTMKSIYYHKAYTRNENSVQNEESQNATTTTVAMKTPKLLKTATSSTRRPCQRQPQLQYVKCRQERRKRLQRRIWPRRRRKTRWKRQPTLQC